MKDIQFRTPGRKIIESDIADFEQEFALSLPDDYRRFMLETNGGEQPKFTLFKTEDGESSMLKGIYSIKGESYRAIDVALVRMEPILPKGALPIGWDVGGNGICLFVSGKRMGEVCFWDHEQEHARDGEPEEVMFVARTFEQFIDSLQAEPERPLGEIEWLGRFGKIADLLNFLGKGNSLECENKDRRTLLMEAARYGNIEMMEAAITHGANMAGVIHFAAMNSQTAAINLLLNHGININERDSQGRTPLACAWNKDFIHFLESKGATK